MRVLQVLGCGDAFSTGGRHNTSFLVKGDREDFLIDCGVTTMLRMNQLAYDLSRVNNIFITHFHGDHFGGLPFLILTYAFKIEEKTPVTIYGPPGIADMTRKLQDALYPDTSVLLDELPVSFVEYNKEWQGTDDLQFRAFEVNHSPPSAPHGLQFKWDGKILAFSGDTEWTESLTMMAKGTELMILECNDLDKDTPGHLSYDKIIANMDLLAARKIMISHMGADVLKAEGLKLSKLSDGDIIPLW